MDHQQCGAPAEAAPSREPTAYLLNASSSVLCLAVRLPFPNQPSAKKRDEAADSAQLDIPLCTAEQLEPREKEQLNDSGGRQWSHQIYVIWCEMPAHHPLP